MQITTQEDEGYFITIGRRVSFLLTVQPYTDGSYGFNPQVRHDVGMAYIGIHQNPPEYLHELQNLVFALTGEELTVNL